MIMNNKFLSYGQGFYFTFWNLLFRRIVRYCKILFIGIIEIKLRIEIIERR